jgi:hypothetical protein
VDVSGPVVPVDAHARLGECALWDERAQAPLWTDIDAAQLRRWRASDGSVWSWTLPERVGSFALCEAPDRLLLGLASGVALFDLEDARLGPLTPVEADEPRRRINDGRCDPQGRFVFGMFNKDDDGVSLSHFHRVGPTCASSRCRRWPWRTAWPSVPTAARCTSPTRRAARSCVSTTTPAAASAGLGVSCSLPTLTVIWTDRRSMPKAICGQRCGAPGASSGSIPTAARCNTSPYRPDTRPARSSAGRSSIPAVCHLGRQGARPTSRRGSVFVADGAGRGRPEHRFRTTLSA